MNNQELADKFTLIADLLEIKGEVVYKILAYRKAADNLVNLGRDVNEIYKDGKLTDIPGVGKAIAEKIEELLTTGELGFLNKLTDEVPASLADLLAVPDLGPKKVGVFWRELGITNLDELKQAAETGKLRDLPGMGEKSEAKVLTGIQALSQRTDRTPLGDAWPFANQILDELRAIPSVKAADATGSLRRMRATVGDIDLLVAAKDSKPVMKAFVEHPLVSRVLGHGDTKSSVEYSNGMRAQLWVHPPERFGTALQYATGSKDHNVRLRELALSQGLSLSEHALTKESGEEILCATEEKVYKTLGLPWIPPELREDRGEIQAAKAGKLPVRLERKDIISELHSHSTWSDGKKSIKEMAEAAIARGYKLLAITDHTHSLGIANGLSIERLHEQRKEIDRVQAELGEAIVLLQGIEMEIRADGSLDFPDEVLAELDIVIASLHVSIRQERAQATQRILNAINNPLVDIIGHLTNRLIPDRAGADLDMEAILAAAAETDTVLEINANPQRLDLDDIYSRRAVEMGIKLAINTDAHKPSNLDFVDYGIAVARRGWVEPQSVINTWPIEKLRTWLQARS